MVEHLLPKQRAVGSIPIARSRYEIDRNRAPEIDQSGALPFSGQRAEKAATKTDVPRIIFWNHDRLHDRLMGGNVPETGTNWELDWTAVGAVATAIATLIIFVAAILALRQLMVVARQQRFEGTIRFFDRVGQTRDARVFVFRELPQDEQGLIDLTRAQRDQVEAVVNMLNELAFLLRLGAVPKDVAFGMTHQVIIRSVYRLKPYIDFRQKREGGRYGRQLEQLDERARKFHTIHPRYSTTTIRLDTGEGEPIEIFAAPAAQGPLEAATRRLRWWLRLY